MIQIDGRKISHKEPPYIVAEISGNHCGSLEKAVALIRAAAVSGANAVKFQLYDPAKITMDCDNEYFTIKEGPWAGRRMIDLYRSAMTPWEWFPELFEEADAAKITAFASVFDKDGVDYLENLGCPAYKIASMEITDLDLIEKAAATGKLVILSTGMADPQEIGTAFVAAGDNVAVLHCVSAYPARVTGFNLRKMTLLQHKYGVSGVSDHTLGNVVAIAATAMGAAIIEKHLCLSRNDPSEDAGFSMTPAEFHQMAVACRLAWEAKQESNDMEEAPMRQLRRSLFVSRDIPKGEAITYDNVCSVRPSNGLPPSVLKELIGHKASKDLQRGQPLKSGDYE